MLNTQAPHIKNSILLSLTNIKCDNAYTLYLKIIKWADSNCNSLVNVDNILKSAKRTLRSLPVDHFRREKGPFSPPSFIIILCLPDLPEREDCALFFCR